jgi:hypothetical protein
MKEIAQKKIKIERIFFTIVYNLKLVYLFILFHFISSYTINSNIVIQEHLYEMARVYSNLNNVLSSISNLSMQ